MILWSAPLLLIPFFILLIFSPPPSLGQQQSPSFLPGAMIGHLGHQQEPPPSVSIGEQSQRIAPFDQITPESGNKGAATYQSIVEPNGDGAGGNRRGIGGGGGESAMTAALKRRPEILSASKERVPTVRAQLRIKLKRYTNFDRRMQNLTTCACDGRNCPEDGKTNRNPCYFSFSAVVSAADQVTDFRFTPFVVVETSGIIDGNKEPEWAAQMEFALPSKPQFIDIYAFNLGPVFSSVDGHVVSWAETVWPVDAWSMDLDDVVPHSWQELPGVMDQKEMIGRLVQSSLFLEFSVQCQNEFMGRKCSLKCAKDEYDLQSTKIYGGANRLTTNQQTARPQSPTNAAGKTLCESALEGKHFYECQYSDVRRYQVNQCQFCQYGVINGTICVRDSALWKEEPNADGWYRMLTVILAILLAILLLILAVTCIFCWIFCRRHSSKIRRESADLGTYRGAAIGTPYNISENGFGTRGHMMAPQDWTKPAQPPLAVQRGILVHPHQMMGGGIHQHHSPHPPPGGPSSSPNTSESDYRPSPFTPRREAQV